MDDGLTGVETEGTPEATPAQRAPVMTADLSIRPDDIRGALDRLFKEFKPAIEAEEIGRVIFSGDGIARVTGLPKTMANELLEFPSELLGVALNLEADEIGVVLLGDANRLREGMPVKQTGRVLSVPVGDAYLGRVVDPLGRPMDGKGPLEQSKLAGIRPLEIQAPSVVERQPVKEPLGTGIKAIDAMTPIGRGQRQLIIGDRQTGKTAVAIDAIINQRQYWGTPNQVKCVYVAVDQKASTVAETVAGLEAAGAMEYTTVINAPAQQPAAFKWMAPFSGSAIGQHWMYNGEHALIVYDDLSKQAVAYRPARRTPATSSTCTPVCWSGAPSCRTSSAAGRSPPCRSSRPKAATSRPTSRPTSSRSPTARSISRPTCSTRASAPP
jgi:F-type H+-transporting ATPase subunit alpha